MKQRSYFWYFYLLQRKYHWNVKRKKARRDNSWMCRYRVNQHLTVLKFFSVSMNKFLVMELVSVQVSQISKLDVKNVNTVKSTTCRYMFPNVIECLKQNIRKLINYKRPSNTKQINNVQIMRIEIWKNKAVRKYKIWTGKVSTYIFGVSVFELTQH